MMIVIALMLDYVWYHGYMHPRLRNVIQHVQND